EVQVEKTSGVPEVAVYVTVEPLRFLGALETNSAPWSRKLPELVKLERVMLNPFKSKVPPALIATVLIAGTTSTVTAVPAAMTTGLHDVGAWLGLQVLVRLQELEATLVNVEQ